MLFRVTEQSIPRVAVFWGQAMRDGGIFLTCAAHPTTTRAPKQPPAATIPDCAHPTGTTLPLGIQNANPTRQQADWLGPVTKWIRFSRKKLQHCPSMSDRSQSLLMIGDAAQK
jgi:hypothetical protein